MAKKKALILEAALRLFAELGFDATPTSQIAREAGVSEGLVFRHFTSKDGLMDAILALADERMKKQVAAIARLPEPLAQIHAVIELPGRLLGEEREFWKLQFSLKWQKKYRNQSYQPSAHHLELVQIAAQAFEKLGYPEPEKEVGLLVLLLDGLSNQLLSQPEGSFDTTLVDFLKSKYQ
ncbi:hypothetical protein GCM10027275_06870 [Rhabdobacter roseus]|uniref:AcrR family transcriptional regulator n=1 Tax=Rhabdobacter roseus TaxID=1655419 RepID=A0A840TGI3_9BACT|nr:TetR/AcrR family transcriptional regulator [Rhabdobacter roseus]MBB5282584.1 AcrR family transcriptional regulator [Rhabdobacter roseus]